MKIIAYLLITLSVVVGTLASSTAYLVNLDKSNHKELSELRLGSPAGVYDPSTADPDFISKLNNIRSMLDAEGPAKANPLKPESNPRPSTDLPPVESVQTGESVLQTLEAKTPIARSGDRLTPELIELLIGSNVTYVKVTEFSISRWDYAWLFGLSCLGLLLGAFMVRRAAQNQLEKTHANQGSSSAQATDAASVFARLSGRLNQLASELEQTNNDGDRLSAILLHIGEIQREDIPAFVADKPALVSQLSLAGYAELMDSFAAMERQLNRAWSAAADSHLPESEDCLRNAQPLLLQTLNRLKV